MPSSEHTKRNIGGADWVAILEAQAACPPARPREPLRLAEPAVSIGSIEPAVAIRLADAGLPLEPFDGRWRVAGPADDGLRRIAEWLHANGASQRWRNELLAVEAEGGHTAARIERAAMRALGLTTRAVHLVGRTEAGEVWVQQRAFDKSTDPGLWDTLMGGQVAAGESTADTLERETREEAGLAIGSLRDLEARGRLTIRRPVIDGYMVEHIEVFEAVVPAGLFPQNRDGEVERFELLTPAALVERLREGVFTLEAALILIGSLRRRGLLPEGPPGKLSIVR